MSARGVWRGEVTRVTTEGVFVRIDRLTGPGLEYGPCPILEGPYALATRVTGVGGGDGHTHALEDPPTVTLALAKGDRVACGFLEGRPDDVFVFGRLRQ